jgi:hypothetical protein
VISARSTLHGSAAISRIAAPAPRLTEGAPAAARPATRNPARRNNTAARRKWALSLTSKTERSPRALNS